MSRHLGQLGEAGLQFCVSGDRVGRLDVVELLIGDHVEVAGAGQTEDDGLFFAGVCSRFSRQ